MFFELYTSNVVLKGARKKFTYRDSTVLYYMICLSHVVLLYYITATLLRDLLHALYIILLSISLCVDPRIASMAVVEEQARRGEKVVGLPEGLREHGRRGRRVFRAFDLRRIQQVRRSRTVRRLRNRPTASVLRQVPADQHQRHYQR